MDLRRNTSPLPPVVGVIGAGNFTTWVFLPALAKTAARLKNIASSGGTSAAIAARKFKFEQATIDTQDLLDDPDINTILITTRHNSHARLVAEALEKGKRVFVEKPLALNRDEFSAVKEALSRTEGRQLLVGFNRVLSASMHSCGWPGGHGEPTRVTAARWGASCGARKEEVR